LPDERDLGPHPKRPPPFGYSLNLGAIGQRAQAVRTLDSEPKLFVVRDVIDDARAAKEDALREELAYAAQGPFGVIVNRLTGDRFWRTVCGGGRTWRSVFTDSGGWAGTWSRASRAAAIA
jgi:hypothetical protein